MEKSAVSLTDEREHTFTEAVSTAFVGIAIILMGCLFGYVVRWLVPTPQLLRSGRVVAGLIILVGCGALIQALGHIWRAQRASHAQFRCPYCENVNLLSKTPHEDFVCEACARTIHFFEGNPVPLRTIFCPACHVEHRVAVTVQFFVCDKCNRQLELNPEEPPRAATTAQEPGAQNVDILLQAYDRRRIDETCESLTRLMGVNLAEARRLLGTATDRTPLIVGFNMPGIKAFSVQQQLREIGATITTRPNLQSVKR